MPSADPEAEEKRRREAEEARLAEIRAHGHAVTPEAFAEVRACFTQLRLAAGCRVQLASAHLACQWESALQGSCRRGPLLVLAVVQPSVASQWVAHSTLSILPSPRAVEGAV